MTCSKYLLIHPCKCCFQVSRGGWGGGAADVSESPATPHAELPPPTPLPVDDQQQEVVAITQQDTSLLHDNHYHVYSQQLIH